MQQRFADGPYGDVAGVIDFFEQVPVMACVLDRELRLVAANPLYRAPFGERIPYGTDVFEGVAEAAPQGFEEALRTVIATGQAVVLGEQRMDFEDVDGDLQTMWVDLAYYPRTGPDGELSGALCMAFDVSERVAARQDAEARLAAVAADFERSRQAVLGLQRSLLPDQVPVLADVDLSAAYTLAGSDDAAGGDWFDVVISDDGRLVCVVGDVVGHGIDAAAAMGRMRAVLEHLLESGADIEAAARSMNEYAARHREAYATTLCLVDLDPDTGEFTYLTAGHPPPVVVDLHADEADAAAFVAPSGGQPLGTGDAGPIATGHLGDDALLVLYTDGAVERPGRTPTQGTVDLGRIVHRAGLDLLYPADQTVAAVDRATRHTLRHLARTSPHGDDTTLLAVQRRQAPAPLELEVTADTDAPMTSRDAVQAWLLPLGIADAEAAAVAHAVTEAVQNVTDHAYRDRSPGSVAVNARLASEGTMTIEITDRGAWREPRIEPGRGRGLALIRHLVDSLTVDGTASGTTATLRHRLHRPAGIQDQRPVTDANHPGLFDIHHDPGVPDAPSYLHGPVDQRAIDELRAHLALRLTQGPSRLTLDLSAVTMLTSAGVSYLYELRDDALAEGTELVLVAPVGSPSHQILTLVGMPSTPPGSDA